MKSEINEQRPEVKRDVYADSRANFPAGTPGRVASTMSRSVYDVPSVTAPRQRAAAQPTERTIADVADVSLELQQLHNMEFGKLEGGDNGSRRNQK